MATNKIMIRAAEEADLQSVTAIYRHHVLTGTGSFETEAPDLSEITRRYNEVVGRGLPYIVAEGEGLVQGYAYAGPYRSRPAYRFTVEDSVYVHPEFQQRGMGEALLATLVSACREKPVRQIVAVIGDSGNRASIRLHEKVGFAHVGVLQGVGFKFGRWLDTVLMQLSLD